MGRGNCSAALPRAVHVLRFLDSSDRMSHDSSTQSGADTSKQEVTLEGRIIRFELVTISNAVTCKAVILNRSGQEVTVYARARFESALLAAMQSIGFAPGCNSTLLAVCSCWDDKLTLQALTLSTSPIATSKPQSSTEKQMPTLPCGTDHKSGNYSVYELEFGTSYPNIPEERVVGVPTRRVRQGTPEFLQLVTNNNPEIVFCRDEGASASRLMTRQLKHKLDVLAQLVRIEWPMASARDSQALHYVIEGWDEFGEHGDNSTFYEGRAVCVSVIQGGNLLNRSLRRLGGLGVEAGFDWVTSTESPKTKTACIQCSVRREP